MGKEKKFITCDGNTAAAHVAYMFSEVAAIYPIKVDKQEAMETFFVNSLWKDHKVNSGSRDCNYIVDGKQKFRIVDAKAPTKMRLSPDIIYARYNTEIGKGNQIPLWLLGFLY